jgi:effector-binding domain-containing protein
MISPPRIEYREEKHTVGIRMHAPFKGMFAEADKRLKELRVWVKRHDIADEGPFFSRYHVIDMNGFMDLEVGFMVSTPLAGDERVKPGILPAGRYATLTYSGSGLRGNKALIEWARENGVVWDRWDDPAGDAFRCRYETYTTHVRLVPRKTKDVELAIKVTDDASRASI